MPLGAFKSHTKGETNWQTFTNASSGTELSENIIFPSGSNCITAAALDHQYAVTIFNDTNNRGSYALIPLSFDGTTATAHRARTAKTITVGGNAQVDTAQLKFGNASALFDGTSDYLSVSSGGFNVGTGNITIEFFVRHNAINDQQVYCDFRTGSNNHFIFYMRSDNKLELYDGGSTYTSTVTMATNTWYHLAISRNGTSLKVYRDGTEVMSATNSRNLSDNSSIAIGSSYEFTSTNSVNGWIDEFRVSSTARYTAAFTPTTVPFVNDSNTLLLLHCDGTDASTTFTDDNCFGFSIGANNVNGSTARICRVNDTTYLFSRFNQQFIPITWNKTTHTVGTENTLTMSNTTIFRTLIWAKNNWLIQMKTSGTVTTIDLIEYVSANSAGTEFVMRVTDQAVTNFGFSQFVKLSETKYIVGGKNTVNNNFEVRLVTVNFGTPSITVGSSTNVETTTAINYYFNFRPQTHAQGITINKCFMCIPTVALGSAGSVKFYPIIHNSATDALTVGTAVTIGSPDAVNYTIFTHLDVYQLNTFHWMLNMMYYNVTTTANRISGLKSLRINTDNTVSETAYVTEKTTTASQLDRTTTSGGMNQFDNHLFREYQDVATNFKVRIVKCN
jgi:hypothetical protein